MQENDNSLNLNKTHEAAIEQLLRGLTQFTDEMDSLSTTLPFLMLLMNALTQDSKKKLDHFVDKYATEKERSKDRVKYSIDMEHAARANKLGREYKNTAITSKLLPRNFVIALISQYDSFLSQIIRFILDIKPEILNSSEKNLSFTDLLKFGTLNEAQNCLIEKEVESVIRLSHSEQFAWLTSKLKMPFDKDLESWPTFIELTERRNLFVHNDGKVSSRYISICREQKCNLEPNLRIGNELDVSQEYFKEGYRCIYEIGVKLVHVIFRKLCPEKLKMSDNNLVEIVVNLIDKGEYEIPIRILDFFTSKGIKHFNEDSRRILIINKAQAYKWAGQGDKCSSILDAEDWSACEDKFKLGIAVLRDNFEDAYSYMTTLSHDRNFLKVFYKDWPIFKQIRKEKRFHEVYEKCYKEKLTKVITSEEAAEDKGPKGKRKLKKSKSSTKKMSQKKEVKSSTVKKK